VFRVYQTQALNNNAHQVCSGVISLIPAKLHAQKRLAQALSHVQQQCATINSPKHAQLLLVLLLLQHNLSAQPLCHFSPKQHACAHKLLLLQQVVE
jgi:hypothetical protein